MYRAIPKNTEPTQAIEALILSSSAKEVKDNLRKLAVDRLETEEKLKQQQLELDKEAKRIAKEQEEHKATSYIVKYIAKVELSEAETVTKFSNETEEKLRAKKLSRQRPSEAETEGKSSHETEEKLRAKVELSFITTSSNETEEKLRAKNGAETNDEFVIETEEKLRAKVELSYHKLW